MRRRNLGVRTRVWVYKSSDPYAQNRNPGFIAEPALSVLLNVTRHLRVGFGASYRIVGDVELADLQDNEISGPAGVVTIKFGGF